MECKETKINLPEIKSLVTENLTFHSVYDFQLTEEAQEKAERELNENENNKNVCLQKLKERLAGDEEMLYRMDESYLLRFLRFKKFDCDRAYYSMNKFYSLRVKHPDFFALKPNLKTLLNSGCITFLPYKDQEGRILFLVDFQKWNTSEMSFKEVLVALFAIYDVITVNPHSQINGIVGIWDFKGMSASHLAQMMRPSLQRFVSNILQECYPLRSSGLLAINCNAFMRTAFNALRHLIKKKITDRIKVIGSDMSELHQFVNPAVLPEEYGGKLEENECSITDFIMDSLSYLKYERSFGLKTNRTN